MTLSLRNLAAGAVAGLAGTVAMNLYWKAAARAAGHDPRALTRNGAHALDEIDVAGRQTEEGEGSTAAAGRIAFEATTGERPDEETRETLSNAVHWSYGAALGALYGAVRGGRKGVVAGGLAFGAAAWLLGDEIAVPVLGLSKGPSAYPPEQHAHRLGAHLVYGVVTAAAARTLGRAADAAGRPRRSALGWAWKAAKTYAKWQVVAVAARKTVGAVR